jgi:hypothetical protein
MPQRTLRLGTSVAVNKERPWNLRRLTRQRSGVESEMFPHALSSVQGAGYSWQTLVLTLPELTPRPHVNRAALLPSLAARPLLCSTRLREESPWRKSWFSSDGPYATLAACCILNPRYRPNILSCCFQLTSVRIQSRKRLELLAGNGCSGSKFS